jgi:hypothetical protein
LAAIRKAAHGEADTGFLKERAMDKINTLSNGEKLVLGGGVLMLIASILPWYKIDFGLDGIVDASFSRNGWQEPATPWSLLAILIAIALAASIAAVRFGNVQLPAMSGGMSWGMIYLGGGGLVALLTLLVLISESSYLSYGFYLAIIAAIAIAAGGYLLYSEEKKGVVRP